jgi:aminoglycoside phosphotransferase (APT) family kinase protein
VTEGRPKTRSPLRLHSPAHGFCDDPETKRLLRSPPTPPATRWVERHLGGRLVATRALRGGMSSAVHRLDVVAADGSRRRAVLRRYVRPGLNEEVPDLAAREAAALDHLETVAVPTPRLVAVDPRGAEAGVPALLMSWLPGRVDWWPKEPEPWLRRLAETLPPVHGSTLPSEPGVVHPFAPYRPSSDAPPAWTRRPSLWEQAAEIVHRPPPAEAAVLIHRDFHPGNVLWRRGEVTGLVDWQAASIGPAAIDVAHCRVNLLGYGWGVAARFTTLWEQASGRAHHPWADVVTIFGFLDDLRDGGGSDRDLVEDLLAEAVAALRGGP